MKMPRLTDQWGVDEGPCSHCGAEGPHARKLCIPCDVTLRRYAMAESLKKILGEPLPEYVVCDVLPERALCECAVCKIQYRVPDTCECKAKSGQSL